MDRHIRTLRKEELLITHGGWFDEENAERVVSWLVAVEERSPVVLVGAGFTLNARDRATGGFATPTQAPLWSHVVRRLAGDLGVSENSYDAPTLFEMYRAALGEAKLRDALRDTVADAALVPGEAHEVLAAYPYEAIVTTNCLDTLLDRACSRGTRRVVVDADLSTSGPRRDLIYLHGHRDAADSWVMTRSQYEDFPRHKPVMVARVRQLLAQHPWLLVGFGMTDPNLHSIIRLIGLEMRGHQPLSLALMRSAPSAAERHHWRQLGFEMVSPSLDEHRRREFADFLAWVIPKLVTTYSPTSAAAKAYVRRGSGPEEKLRRFRDVYRTATVDRDEAYREWSEQLKELLTAEQQAEAAEAARQALQDARSNHIPSLKTGLGTGTSHAISPPPVPALKDPLFDGLDVHPTFRPLASFEVVQWLERLLREVKVDDLAEHFKWGLDQRVFEGATDELALEVLAIRLAKRARSNGRLQLLLGVAVASARKYGREKVEELLKAEAAVLGFELPSTEGPPEQGHLQAAKAGYDAYMDADFETAAKKYEEAARLAAGAQLDFEEWAYTVGQSDSLSRVASRTSRSARDKTAEDEQRRVRREGLRESVERLSKLPAVERWIKRAEVQSRAVLQEVATRSRERERFRITGGWGRRFGGDGHSLWRSFRDLETIHAPPSLRQHYFQPLVPLLSANHAALVLSNATKPREWLVELLSDSPESLADRQSRDKMLVDVVLEDEGALTRTERAVRLEWIPELTTALRADDVAMALGWVGRVAVGFPDSWVDTAWDSRAITRHSWAAFSSSARWVTEPSVACDAALVLFETLGGEGRAGEDAVKALYELPWQSWRPLGAQTGKRFLETLTRLIPSVAGRGLAIDYALFTLLRLLDAGLTPDALAPHVDVWKALLESVKAGKHETHFGESRRAGFFLQRKLAGSVGFPARSVSEVFSDWFDRSETGDDGDRREEEWITLADVVDESPELLDRLRNEVERLFQDARAIARYGRNPHLSYGPLLLLTKGVKLLEAERPKIGALLVRLVAAAPSFMSVISEVLVPQWWEAGSWDELMATLAAACGGGGARSDEDDVGLSTRRQLGVLGLFGELPDTALSKAAPFVWSSLRSFSLAAVNDERLLIANRAAFSVVGVAGGVEDAAEAKLYAEAIRRISADPRVPVRSAVAHAGPELAMRARSASVREAARDGVREVQRDDNAQVSALLKAATSAVSPKSARTDVDSESGTVQNGAASP